MNQIQLFQNAMPDAKSIKAEYGEDWLQYHYEMINQQYFTRIRWIEHIRDWSIIHGVVATDGKSYASSLPYNTISALISLANLHRDKLFIKPILRRDDARVF